LLDAESVAGHLLRADSVFAFLAAHRAELFPDEMFADLFPTGPKATHPDTAVDVLSKILARDGAPVSTTTAEREAADPLLRVAAAADMYQDALGTAAEKPSRRNQTRQARDPCRHPVPAPHPRRRLARAAQPPGPAGMRRTQPRRGPIAGRSQRRA